MAEESGVTGEALLSRAGALGADRAYLIAPDWAEEAKAAGASAILVLLAAWRPFEARRDGRGPGLCAYYLAENGLYHRTAALLKELEAAGVRAERNVTLRVKPLLERTGLAARGENDLMAVRGLGSLFAVQIVLLWGVSPLPLPEGEASACLHCGRCRAACPSGALGQGYCREDCVRNWMDGQPMEEFAMEKISLLLGCERCQRVCPRNAGIPLQPYPAELLELLTWERLVNLSPTDKKALAALVGKNLLGRKRIETQALLLAEKARWPGAAQAAEELLSCGSPAAERAAQWVLARGETP